MWWCCGIKLLTLSYLLVFVLSIGLSEENWGTRNERDSRTKSKRWRTPWKRRKTVLNQTGPFHGYWWALSSCSDTVRIISSSKYILYGIYYFSLCHVRIMKITILIIRYASCTIYNIMYNYIIMHYNYVIIKLCVLHYISLAVPLFL